MKKRHLTAPWVVAVLIAVGLGRAQVSVPPVISDNEISEYRESLRQVQADIQLLQLRLDEILRRESRLLGIANQRSTPAGGSNNSDQSWAQAARAYAEGSRAENQHEFLAAAAHYTRAIELDPGNDSAFLHRGLCFFQSGNLTRAIADLSESLRLQPNNARAYQLRADAYYSQGSLTASLSDLDQSIRRDSLNAPLYGERARVYRSLGHYGRALEDCASFLQLAPQMESAFLCRAATLIALGRKVEAIRDLREVLKSNPQSDEAKQLLASTGPEQPTIKAPGMVTGPAGQVLGRVGQSAIAPRIDSPAEVNPSNVLPREAPIPGGLPKSQPPLSADFPKPGLTGAVPPPESRASAPSNCPAPGDQRHEALMLVHQGRQLVNSQSFQRAIEVFDRAISLDPSSALAFNSRGYAYLRIEDFKRAVEDFSTAIMLQGPGYTNAQLNLSVARKRMRRSGT